MKKLILFAFFLMAVNANAQTAAELLGKWQLVKWTVGGKGHEIKQDTYQVFNDGGKFVSISEGKEHNGKWKLSKDSKQLKITSGIIVVNFNIDFFDARKRIISSDKVGTLEYKKVEQ